MVSRLFLSVVGLFLGVMLIACAGGGLPKKIQPPPEIEKKEEKVKEDKKFEDKKFEEKKKD